MCIYTLNTTTLYDIYIIVIYITEHSHNSSPNRCSYNDDSTVLENELERN